jgi:hypothetical protein
MKIRCLIYCTVLILLTGSGPALSQISISGLTDFELRVGGDDSSPNINQTPSGGLSVYTPNIRLFLSANINEQWFVNACFIENA